MQEHQSGPLIITTAFVVIIFSTERVKLRALQRWEDKIVEGQSEGNPYPSHVKQLSIPFISLRLQFTLKYVLAIKTSNPWISLALKTLSRGDQIINRQTVKNKISEAATIRSQIQIEWSNNWTDIWPWWRI